MTPERESAAEPSGFDATNVALKYVVTLQSGIRARVTRNVPRTSSTTKASQSVLLGWTAEQACGAGQHVEMPCHV